MAESSAQIALNLPGDSAAHLRHLLIYVGWRFIEPRKLWAARAVSGPPAAPNPAANNPPDTPWYVLLAVGLGAGVTSGLFGIGGGLVIVPALVALLHYDQKRAVGTSLGALLPPVGIGAVLSYYEAERSIWRVSIVAFGLIFGAFLGARIALGLPSSTVKRLYGVFLMIVSLRFIFQV